MFGLFGISEEKIQKWTQKGKINNVLRAADNTKPEIRKAAITALGEFDVDEAFNYLVVTLRDPNPEIRILAAKALGTQGKALAVEHLRHVSLKDDDEEVKKVAVDALKAIDVPLVDEEE
ncbi:MAG: HEAT repeat domain-containing protein [Clostridiales bacterium]|nr:HEAT repeat domain-containing protein [Clostridiales bacterium]